jgi:hypothetical protein
MKPVIVVRSLCTVQFYDWEKTVLVSRPCPDGKFKCTSGHCISNTSRCDGYAQCGDGSDEAGCPPRYPDGRHCPLDRFTCNNTICINQNWVCDGGNFNSVFYLYILLYIFVLDNDCRDNR